MLDGLRQSRPDLVVVLEPINDDGDVVLDPLVEPEVVGQSNILVVASHDLHLIANTCNKALVMQRGHVGMLGDTAAVLGEQGEQLGIMPIAEALRLAQSRGIDLVEIAPRARPPTCRIVDYGKFRYELSRRRKRKG